MVRRDECENDGGFLDLEMEACVEAICWSSRCRCAVASKVSECGSHSVVKGTSGTHVGDERSPESRCRLVKEVKKRNNTEEESAEFFESVPLLEVKFLIAEAMTKRVSQNNRPLKLSFIDVKKGHLCGRTTEYCLAVASHVWQQYAWEREWKKKQ